MTAGRVSGPGLNRGVRRARGHWQLQSSSEGREGEGGCFWRGKMGVDVDFSGAVPERWTVEGSACAVRVGTQGGMVRDYCGRMKCAASHARRTARESVEMSSYVRAVG